MIARVLIANRGEVARRLIRQFKKEGIETVVVFSEPDVEQPWIEEADYAVYLNGRTVAETYMDARRVVSAAMDAGCDAIHPGYCFLAERPDFVKMAGMANLSVIGADFRVLTRAVDRFDLRRVARDLSIPIIPASDPLPEGDDGVAAGAQLGFPLYVKAVQGAVVRRVESLAALPEAVAAMRDLAEQVTGSRSVYLERAVDRLRRLGTVVVADRHDNVVHLGVTDGSLQLDYRSWVEEMGEQLVGHDLHERMGKASADVARAIGWVGVGRVRWAVLPDGGWYLLGFSPRLTTGYSLAELVHGVDLVHTQLRIHDEEELGWGQGQVKFTRHGVQLRVFPVDVAGGGGPATGTIERLVVPEGEHVLAEVGTAEGQPVNDDTDPLLVKLTVTGPTRHAALVRARAALSELVIEGVPTNRDFLLELVANEQIWRGGYDVHTLPEMIRAAGVR